MLSKSFLSSRAIIQRGVLASMQAKNLSTTPVYDKNVAVILSGCGV